VELLHEADPMLMVDGELMADDAVSPEIHLNYPFSRLKGGANVLIFPDLDSANIADKLLSKIGGGETLGPILMGMSKPVHLLPRGAQVEQIVNVTAIAVVDSVGDGSLGPTSRVRAGTRNGQGVEGSSWRAIAANRS